MARQRHGRGRLVICGDTNEEGGMSEVPHDISYVKILKVELLTPAASEHSQGLWGEYEVVNIGTAPTTDGDVVAAAVCFSGTVIHSKEHRLDNPVLEPNGGSFKGTFHFPWDQLPYGGDWELVLQVDRPGIGETSDAEHHPFTVDRPHP